jgi:hypothetical protein
MRAVVQDRYGSIDAPELREIETPAVADDQVLVRIHAASVHPDVWHVLHGRPQVLRLMGAGLSRLALARKRRSKGLIDVPVSHYGGRHGNGRDDRRQLGLRGGRR